MKNRALLCLALLLTVLAAVVSTQPTYTAYWDFYENETAATMQRYTFGVFIDGATAPQIVGANCDAVTASCSTPIGTYPVGSAHTLVVKAACVGTQNWGNPSRAVPFTVGQPLPTLPVEPPRPSGACAPAPPPPPPPPQVTESSEGTVVLPGSGGQIVRADGAVLTFGASAPGGTFFIMKTVAGVTTNTNGYGKDLIYRTVGGRPRTAYTTGSDNACYINQAVPPATEEWGYFSSTPCLPPVTPPPPPPNQSPVISLTSPIGTATLALGATVPLAATASDPDGSVLRVEFLVANELLSNDNTAPYQGAWTPIAAGSYQVQARAVDNAGATALSAIATVVVVAPPPPPPPVETCAADGTGNGVDEDKDGQVDEGCKVPPPAPTAAPPTFSLKSVSCTVKATKPAAATGAWRAQFRIDGVNASTPASSPYERTLTLTPGAHQLDVVWKKTTAGAADIPSTAVTMTDCK